MKNLSLFFVLSLFSLLFWQSCSQKDETLQPNADAFWQYNGKNPMTAKAVKDLKGNASNLPTEVNGQPLWKNGTAIRFEDQKNPILVVPVKSQTKNKVEEVLVVSYENNKMAYTRISPKDKSTPFKSHIFWKGYINALNKELFNLTSGKATGFKKKKLDKTASGLSAARTLYWEICGYYWICFYIEWEEDGIIHSYEYCYEEIEYCWVDDPI